jgi:metal-dependent HD superfamily phosphatase/phosphodiesterase
MRSQKEIALDGELLAAAAGQGLSPAAMEGLRALLADEEVQALQEYANTVSIKRLNYNDHGPVHMRTVALNALIMMGLLREAGIPTSLQTEEAGSYEDSLAGVVLAACLHDVGMSVGRQDHELHSANLAGPLLDRFLGIIYPGNIQKRVMVRSLALEGIAGHMGSRTIHSLEAGVILVADGCDMKKGRARISMALAPGPRVGDIHQFSANSIEEVRILRGQEKPVRIEVSMSAEVGLFQIEEVLLGKIAASPAKGYIELYSRVLETPPRRYL